MNIDFGMKTVRVKIRQSSKKIMDDVVARHLPNVSSNNKSKVEICVFCGTQENLTKEHVLPRWTFGKSTEDFFITDTNISEQSYNKTTIPACAECNNSRLASIENYIISIFKNTNLKENFFDKNEIQNIIRWLEIIEYKFQILEIRRKFIKTKAVPTISFFRDIPISVMRKNIEYSPRKAIAEIRYSQKRIAIKDKSLNENSLVIFNTKNESFYFFHHLNDFIYLELPEFKIALFYFYNRTFNNSKEGYEEAMKIIESVYNT
ncbi:hypothetical protein [Flavobacterium maritimum]|uniref:hypothetical protein n=1 Tax=Flavobacterium maritimum TaxID=3149042 RepID=UPI0032B44401